MVRFGWFWRGFLHHTYRVRFHTILDRTSHLESKNRSTQGAVNLSNSVWFIWLYDYGKKIMWLNAKEKRKMVGGSLKIWDWEENTTNCSAGFGFGRNIMWLRAKKKRKMVRWEPEILRLRGKKNEGGWWLMSDRVLSLRGETMKGAEV